MVYFESFDPEQPVEVSIDPQRGGGRLLSRHWSGTFQTVVPVEPLIIDLIEPQTELPEIYYRALEALNPKTPPIRQVQFTLPNTADKTNQARAFRSIGLYRRSDRDMEIQSQPDPNNPERSITVITNGMNIVIKGVNKEMRGTMLGETQDISAESAVIYAKNFNPMQRSGESTQEEDDDFEVYLSGNIVFLDGDRTIYADKMYYDAKNKLGYIVNGEVIAPIPNMSSIHMKGLVRMKAEILRQQGDGVFEGQNAMVTTSLLGEPTYSLSAKTVTLEETKKNRTRGFTGEPVINPETGQPEIDKRLWLVSENNFINAGRVPVFYWPWMATDAQDPILYIKTLGYGNDDIYGSQFRTTWNPFQILNIKKRPEGVDWEVRFDYLSRRGFGHGTTFDYRRDSCFNIPGATYGKLDFWGINDTGTDILTSRRRNIGFPDAYRYQIEYLHRQYLGTGPDPWRFTARVGKTSDANFLEQYYFNSWMTQPNRTTELELKQTEGNRSFGLKAEYALDSTVTNTNSLPRLDFYLLGQSLLNDTFTWHSHTRLGYMQYTTADLPYDARDIKQMRYLDQEVYADAGTNPQNVSTIKAQGEVFSTRHELDLPLSLGPLRVVPYVLGDFSHWGEGEKSWDETTREGSLKSADRLYGQAGIRVNLPFWKVMPNVSSRTWYVNGLAHKVDFDAEFMHASADKHLDNLIVYDALDDWSTDSVRRRFALTTFNGVAPPIYDPRYYALRSGIARNVSSPVMEIADSLTMMRVGMTHRWQTKRGPTGRRNIIDWIVFSTHFNYYPEQSQNYGESIGLIDYDFRWHVGDRFTVFSSGLFDAGTDSQKAIQLGMSTQRIGRGSLTVAVDWFDGCVSRTYLSLGTAYTMNEKYAMSYNTSFDLNKNNNSGHNFMFIRTGESFRVMLGANYNPAVENWSFSFGIEPNFLPGIMNRMNSATRAEQNVRR